MGYHYPQITYTLPKCIITGTIKEVTFLTYAISFKEYEHCLKEGMRAFSPNEFLLDDNDVQLNHFIYNILYI